MRNIKKFEDFTNEEINWRKAATGVALGAGLAFSNPSKANIDDSSNRIENIQQSSVDIDGWGKVKWGMTPEQVKSQYPEAIPDSSEFSKGSTSLLKIVNFSLGSNTYDVNFVFKDNKLEFVRLQLDEDEAYESTFNSIKSNLIEKYGQSIFDKPKDKYGLESKWSTESGTIKLTLYTMPNIGTTGYVMKKIWIQYKKKEVSGF